MRELIEAFSNRLRAPLLGNFLIAVFVINWKEFLILLFGSSNLFVRIQFFENAVSFNTLVTYPILLSFLLTAAQPIVSLVGAYISYWPLHWKRMLQLKSDASYEDEKGTLEIHRRERIAKLEGDLVDRAKRDDEVAQIQDDEVRINLQRQLDDLRRDVSKGIELQPGSIGNLSPLDNELSAIARSILVGASNKDGEIIKGSSLDGIQIIAGTYDSGSISSGREIETHEAAISELERRRLIRSLGLNGEVFRLTHEGFKLADLVKSNPN